MTTTRFCAACHCEVHIYDKQCNLINGDVVHLECFDFYKEKQRQKTFRERRRQLRGGE